MSIPFEHSGDYLELMMTCKLMNFMFYCNFGSLFNHFHENSSLLKSNFFVS